MCSPREEFQGTVARVRSIRATNSESFYRRAFDNTIRTFRRKEWEVNEEKGTEKRGVVEPLQISKIFFERRIICRDFELRTMSKRGCLLV